ncbi:SsrA-binding protein SmpB [Gilvimarinus agarilyticus]|uniref:SsrA-binding protein SmpB n=1 Tax=unclassified Gilvimarinus TaxID=2642066 RepID=UPI001C08F1F7|nr:MULTISPECIES: SsrA-binding protein SmpB [unclassified Gilvimarinus]MBU2884478.1 SsrA-binding protein SmpB [Gilvimarinus agarilyticus]MDO6569614.1 SsrA-binding protein SmpB [Gilvimarinus sp. 2_MG-2023]MDO6748573.1 SsrA-binding protein SmpB [Gilvimarinus sp. 1_MG-2023]
MAKKQKSKSSSNTIALNKKSRHDYQLQDKLETGIALLGWEVKSAREGKVQLTDTYVIFQNGEAWLVGAQFTPLKTVSTHFVPENNRSRKLLMHSRELEKYQRAAEQKGFTVVATAMYWKQHLIKVEVALGKGKQLHDKRETEKERDWSREKQRLFQHNQR